MTWDCSPQAWLEQVTPAGLTAVKALPPHLCPLWGGVWGPKRGSLEGQRAGETKQGLSPSPAPQHARPKAMGSVTFLGEALGRVKGRQNTTEPSAWDLKERKRGHRKHC